MFSKIWEGIVRLRKPGSRFRRAFMLTLFLFGTPIKGLLPLGIAFVLIAELVVLLSYGTLRRSEELSTRGPYALVRNPVYAAVILASAGFFILAGAGFAPPHTGSLPYIVKIDGLFLNPIAMLLALLFFPAITIHYLRRIRNEEEKLSGIFGEKFGDYLKRVPTRLLPYPPAFARIDWLLFTFSSEVAFRNHTFSRILKYAIWLVLFIGKEAYLRDVAEGNYWRIWQHRDFSLFIAAFAALLILHTTARILQRRFEKFHN